MAQELEHGAGPGAGTDAGAGGGGGGPGHLRLRPRQPLRPRQSLRLRLRPQPRSYPLRRRWSPLAGGRWQCAPLRPRAGACSWAPSAFWGSLRIMGGKGYRSSWSRRQDPEQERTREQSLGALATCDCGRYRVCDRGCHYDCGCGHGRGCAHCTGGTRSLPVWERALRVGFGARWLRSDS